MAPYFGILVPNEEQLKWNTAEKTEKTYLYDIWLIFPLLAFIIIVPRWYWQDKENGTVETLMSGLPKNTHDPILLKRRCETITQFLRLHGSNNYLFNYYIYKVIILASLYISFIFIDYVLKDQFHQFGYQVYLGNNSYHNVNFGFNSAEFLFPNTGVCDLKHVGPSGNVINNSAVCKFPQNLLLGKIFVYIWFYYLLFTISFCVITTTEIFIITIPSFAAFVIKFRLDLPIHYLKNFKNLERVSVS